MPQWKASDGTSIEIGRGNAAEGPLVVRPGTSTLAVDIAHDLQRTDQGHPPWIEVGALPDGVVPFDAREPFLVDALVRHLAGRLGLTVECDTKIPIPRAIKELLESLAADEDPSANGY